MSKLLKGLGTAMTCISLLLVGCFSSENSTANPTPTATPVPSPVTVASHNKLTIGMRNHISLNPIENTDKSVEQVLYLMFNTLVDIKADGNITPNIATSWQLAGNVLNLTIRDDIKWHDGKPLTAEDVKFSMEYIQKTPGSPYKIAVKGVGIIQVIDATHLQITYSQPFSGVYQSLFFPVIPKHVYGVEDTTKSPTTPIGSGPYAFESAVPHKNMMLKANPNYFKGKPHIETIDVMITPDEQSSLYAFEQKLIDLVYTDTMDWGKYAKDQDVNTYELLTNTYDFIGVNFNKPLFQNKNIREALLYAIDRQKLIDLYYLGHGLVADTPISPNSYLYDISLEPKSYDKEKAKLLLAQEGYEKDSKTDLFTKNNMPLQFDLLVNKENVERLKVAEELKKMYKSMGITVQIDAVDSATYKNRIYSKQFDAFLGGWKLSYVPDFTFAFHSSQIASGDNFISYKDPTMDDLLKASFNASPESLKDATAKFQQHFAKQNPYLSLYFKTAALITRNHIIGNIAPNPSNIFSNIEEWSLKN